MQKIKVSILFIILFIFLIYDKLLAQDEEKKFLSLRNDKVNVRQGPNWNYPIKFVYNKKYLPVLLIDSSEIWRKIQDYENNVGWIHVSKLSKRKSAINIKNYSIVFKKSTIYSEPLIKLETGRLVLIKKCTNFWCKIKVKNFVGWVKKENLWGRVN